MKNMLRPFPLLCILALLGGNTNHNTLTAQTKYGRQGDWFIVNKGDAASLLAAIDAAKTVNGAKIFLPDGTYDLGETVKTVIAGKNVSLIGQSAEKTVIRNAPPVTMEGLDQADLLKNTSQGLYMQDLTLRNDLDYYHHIGNAGRAVTLHDKGTKTVCKNVIHLSYQDTYYSHKEGGLYYHEGGEIHGLVDYMCGSGRAYFNRVTMVNEKHSTAATMTANSELYVFNECIVKSRADKYNFGRAWNNTPVCVWLNTTLEEPRKLIATRWNLKGIAVDYSVAGEYGTKDTGDQNITPAKNEVVFAKQNTKMNTILSADEAALYTIDYVLGDWAATAQQSTIQLPPPADAKYADGQVTFGLTDNGMTACALFKNGEFLALSTDGTFPGIVINPATDVLTIRTANQRGGFGPEGHVAGTATSSITPVNSAAPHAAIHDLRGYPVSKTHLGLYIVNGRKVMM